MRVIYDCLVPVEYGYLSVGPQHVDLGFTPEARGGQRNGLCGAAVPGHLSMVTGRHDGGVPLRVEIHDAVPPLGEQWEDVVEVSFEPIGAPYRLTAFAFGVPLDLPGSGTYRVRWSACGMDAAQAGELPGDRYLLQLWPAPWAPDAIVRQTSARAAYWHSMAATTPPPSPTQHEHAESAERGQQAVAAQLASPDRSILDELAALTPAQQRQVAHWAARRACERAGVANHPVVVDAVRRLSRGEPVPELWQEWSTAWDAVFPAQRGGDVGETVLTRQVPDATVRRAAPEMAAVGAVMSLADPHPGRAAAGAVDYLSTSVPDPRTAFDEVRDVVAQLRASTVPQN